VLGSEKERLLATGNEKSGQMNLESQFPIFFFKEFGVPKTVVTTQAEENECCCSLRNPYSIDRDGKHFSLAKVDKSPIPFCSSIEVVVVVVCCLLFAVVHPNWLSFLLRLRIFFPFFPFFLSFSNFKNLILCRQFYLLSF